MSHPDKLKPETDRNMSLKRGFSLIELGIDEPINVQWVIRAIFTVGILMVIISMIISLI